MKNFQKSWIYISNTKYHEREFVCFTWHSSAHENHGILADVEREGPADFVPPPPNKSTGREI